MRMLAACGHHQRRIRATPRPTVCSPPRKSSAVLISSVKAWTGGAGSPPLAPDPDPIAAPDQSTFGGHGTHVADIIGGTNGVAPDVKLYAVKACAVPTSACSGVALMQAVEWAIDPNGDGDTKDHVDIINMSLGSDYGQPFDDDLSAAVDRATKLGAFTVASAGNGSDKPFITGSPAAAVTALSVAQTNVPSAVVDLMTIVIPAVTPAERGAIHQDWSAALTTAITAPVVIHREQCARLYSVRGGLADGARSHW